jgi:hypothetical protein
MAHIKIQDLPAGANLTPEEEELILGAGLATFRPTLESLETRQMLDAGLGSNLQLPIGPSMGGTPQHSLVNHLATTVQETTQQVRQLATSVLQSTQAALQGHIDQAFAAFGRQGLPQSMAPGGAQAGLHSDYRYGDSKQVIQEAQKFLQDKIIDGGPAGFNLWFLKGNAQLASKEIDGDKIKVSFKVAYTRLLDSDGTCHVDFTFQGKNAGGVKAYHLVRAGLRDWQGQGPLGDFVGGKFEGVAKDLFNSQVFSITCHRFEEWHFADNAIRQAEQIYGVKEGTFQKNRVERIDGGARLYIYTDKNEFNPKQKLGGSQPTGRGELWLTFKYDDADLASGKIQLTEVRQGYHWQEAVHRTSLWSNDYNQRWQDTGTAQVHSQLMNATWWAGAAGETAHAVRREILGRLHDLIGQANEEAGTGGFRNVQIWKTDGGYQVSVHLTWPNFKEAKVDFVFTNEKADPATGRLRFDARIASYSPGGNDPNLASFFEPICRDFSVQVPR